MFFPTHQEAESSSSLEPIQPCRQFMFSEIQLTTQNFDDSLVIGRGGFGKVYKGTITYGAIELDVAIKRLESTSNQGASEFWAEVKMLSKLRHCHLVSLIGYCNNAQEMILVYEYMPRGTLEDHLHRRIAPLTWVRRLKICIGAARGLDYLHTGVGTKHGVIHRDVKSSNILLDECWAAKISDFGLSKIGPTNQRSTYVNTLVKGTFGYLDPDYYSTGRLTRKSDVYAFGVVLFEVLCGKRAVFTSTDKEKRGLATWAKGSIKEGRLKQIVDSNMTGTISPKCLREFAQLADHCLDRHPKQRPTMAEVVFRLESVLALQEKSNNRLHPGGMTLFGRKVPMLLFPFSGENSVGGRSLNSLELFFATVGGESRMLHRFDFENLSVATGHFSDANRTFGANFCWMYKGRLQNGQQIAITQHSYDKNRERIREVELLVKLEHGNLADLLGYCIIGRKVFLVYDFAPFAVLRDLIFGRVRTCLDWSKHYKRITLGVARALLYLHKNAPIQIIHGDVNPRNIYLDENMNPKLFGFGFARCLAINKADGIDADWIRRDVRYMAPEDACDGRLSTKVDVFGFGVLILEIISGRPMYGLIPSDGGYTGHVWKNWLEGTPSNILRPTIDADPTSIRFIHIGLLCVQKDADIRPTMEEVIGMLLGGSPLTLPLPQMPVIAPCDRL